MLYSSQVVTNHLFPGAPMQEEQVTMPLDAVENERQANRIRVTHIILLFAMLQSATLNLFAVSGSLLPWVAVAFMLLSVGSAAAFWGLYKSGINQRWEHKDLSIHQCLVVLVIQFGFIFLAPKLTILFLLAALVVFAYGMVQLSYYHFTVGWLAYTAISGIALWMVRGRFDYPGVSTMQVTMLWAFLSLILAAFVLARTQSSRLYTQLSAAREEVAALLAKLDAVGRHDMLTGALNRRAMIETLDSELLRAKRTGHPFCFAIIDLDHFRLVNEKHGNGVGDVVLKTVSEVSLKLLRALDRFGRIGGEEFGIVLPATWLDHGVIALNRLTKAVGECDWERIAPGLNVTFSAGITTNAVNDTAEVIIRRADEALTQAKQQGRNRIVQAEEELPDMPPIDID
jgi:diguanylate cyclase (GGDEF)-like protein